MNKALSFYFLVFFAVLGFLWSGAGGPEGLVDDDIGGAVALLLAFFLFYALDVSLRSREFGWINAEFFFVSFFSIFHFSYVVLFYFDIAGYDREIFYHHTSLVRAIGYSLLCLVMFLIGYRCAELRAVRVAPDRLVGGVYIKVFSFSKFLIIFSIFLFWIPIISVLPLVYNDYKALISVGSISPIGRLFWVGQYIGYCALSLYYVSKRFSGLPYHHGIFGWIIGFYVLGYLLIGDRGGFISYVAIVIFCHNFYCARISGIKLFSFLIVALIVSSIVAVARVESVIDPVEAARLYGEKGKGNPVIEALIEFGGSIKTVGIAFYYVPDSYGYWFGKSYLDALLNVFPNFLGGARSSSGGVGAFVTEVAFGPLSETYGRGGSIAMEAYVNFGILGCLTFFLIGFVLHHLYKLFLFDKSLIVSVAFLATIAALAMWMRNSSSMSFRIIVWAIIVAYFCKVIALSIGVRRLGTIKLGRKEK